MTTRLRSYHDGGSQMLWRTIKGKSRLNFDSREAWHAYAHERIPSFCHFCEVPRRKRGCPLPVCSECQKADRDIWSQACKCPMMKRYLDKSTAIAS